MSCEASITVRERVQCNRDGGVRGELLLDATEYKHASFMYEAARGVMQ